MNRKRIDNASKMVRLNSTICTEMGAICQRYVLNNYQGTTMNARSSHPREASKSQQLSIINNHSGMSIRNRVRFINGYFSDRL